MITSLYGSVRFLGVAFGPPLFSWLMSISHKTVFFSMGCLSLFTLIIAFFFIKPEKSKKRESGSKQQLSTVFKKREKVPTS
jgi:MFS transporter, ACDE family, multidrug resistance protein